MLFLTSLMVFDYNQSVHIYLFIIKSELRAWIHGFYL